MSWSPDAEAAGEGTGARRKRRRSHGAPAAATFSTVFDLVFLKSIPGVLLIVQLVCTFMGVVLAGSWRGSYSPGHVFFILVDVVAFLVCFILIVCRTIRLDDLTSRNVDWNIVFCYYSGPAGLLLLIASCVMVEVAAAASALKAAGVFGLFAWNSLLCSFLLHGKPVYDLKRNKLPTATATVIPGAPATSDVSRDDFSGEVSDDFSSDEETTPAVGAAPGDGGVTLIQATLRPPSIDVPPNNNVSDSSLYPVDISGSNRASDQRPQSAYSTKAANWGLQ